MTVQYEGTNYHGWQIQRNAITIQEVLEATFASILNEKVRIVGAGRTDAGVHALAQMANFHTANPLSLRRLFRGANSLLPVEISIPVMEEADPNFNSRRDAKRKEYYYQIWNGDVISPFLAPFAKHVPFKLDVGAMKRASCFFLGEHDFSSFCSSHSLIEDKVRKIFISDIEIEGDLIRYRVIANGFLQHMVRTMVGTLLDIGKHRMPENGVVEILNARDRRRAGFSAPARGLFLVKVYY